MEQQVEVLEKLKVEKDVFYEQLDQEDIKYWKLKTKVDNHVARSATLTLGAMLG